MKKSSSISKQKFNQTYQIMIVFIEFDEDLNNITHEPVDEDDTDNSSSEYGMLNPDLLDSDLTMQGYVENIIGPV